MVSSIANSLGFGSGLDVKQLVTDLSNASREPKIARVTELTQTKQTRISALAQARADLDGFADSLSQTVNEDRKKGGAGKQGSDSVERGARREFTKKISTIREIHST